MILIKRENIGNVKTNVKRNFLMVSLTKNPSV
jgi:hypothetical protein